MLKLLEQFNAARDANDKLANWRECLEGGNAARGESIVWGRSEASCRRCHKVGDQGGEVGPDLTKIGATKEREYLLRAIVYPSAEIAKGFESNIIVTDRGFVLAGIVKSETEDEVVLMRPDGELIQVRKDTIDEREKRQSAMTELVKHLSKRDLRDIIEYLSNQRGK